MTYIWRLWLEFMRKSWWIKIKDKYRQSIGSQISSRSINKQGHTNGANKKWENYDHTNPLKECWQKNRGLSSIKNYLIEYQREFFDKELIYIQFSQNIFRESIYFIQLHIRVVKRWNMRFGVQQNHSTQYQKIEHVNAPSTATIAVYLTQYIQGAGG